MINFDKDTRVKVWKVEDKGNWTQVSFSTQRKDKRDNEQKYSNWSFVRFVGNAHAKADQLEEKMWIVIKGGMSKESYEKDGETLYPKNPQMVVFNWEEHNWDDSPSSKGNIDTPPNVADDSYEDDEVPF